MTITISGSGEDTEYDHSVQFVLVAESDTHKTTHEFNNYADVFLDFAKRLKKMPFESKRDILFEADDIKIKVKLVDALGKVELWLATEDWDGQGASFYCTTDPASLHRFAETLLSSDFSMPHTITWDSDLISRIES